MAQDCRVFVFFYFSSSRSPLPLGAGGDLSILGYSDCGIGLCDFLLSLFQWHHFASPPLAKVVALLRFSAFRRHLRAPPPLSGDFAVIFLDIFPVPYG